MTKVKDLLTQIADKIRQKLDITYEISPVDFSVLIYNIAGDFFTKKMFDSTGQGLKSIKNIKFKETVEHISEGAFLNMSIESIELHEKIKTIEKNAFSDCKSIPAIVIPQSVTNIGSNAFQNCTNLESVSVDSRNSVYDSRDNCNAIIETLTNTLITGCRKTTIPADVNYIGDGAFYGIDCSEITLPDGLKGIGSSSFSYASGIQHFNCPNLEEIGASAFYYNTMEKFTINNPLGKIGGAAFRDCAKLKEVHVGSLQHWCNITFVNYMSTPLFNASCNLYIDGALIGDNLTIPNEVKAIKDFTFAYFKSLKNVILHSSITSIGKGAFRGCLNLENIGIPNEVSSLGAEAFYGCSKLSSIYIPNSIKLISADTFSGCTNLISIDFTNHLKVPTLSNVNAFANTTCKFIVPDDLYDDWKSATNWSTYKDRIIKASEYTEL